MFKGQRVKDLIERKGMTQIEVAKKAKIAQGTFGSILSDAGNPRAKNLQKMAQVLECSIDEFFDWEPDFIPVSTVNRAGEEMPKYGLPAIKRENIHLHQLLEEKERLIAVLMKNEKQGKDESKE
jgi:transcriptional regulator with XRE-family HTH domain